MDKFVVSYPFDGHVPGDVLDNVADEFKSHNFVRRIKGVEPQIPKKRARLPEPEQQPD